MLVYNTYPYITKGSIPCSSEELANNPSSRSTLEGTADLAVVIGLTGVEDGIDGGGFRGGSGSLIPKFRRSCCKRSCSLRGGDVASKSSVVVSGCSAKRTQGMSMAFF